MENLVYLGHDRAGLEEARRDVERYARQLTLKLYPLAWSEGSGVRGAVIREVTDAVSCPARWPTV